MPHRQFSISENQNFFYILLLLNNSQSVIFKFSASISDQVIPSIGTSTLQTKCRRFTLQNGLKFFQQENLHRDSVKYFVKTQIQCRNDALVMGPWVLARGLTMKSFQIHLSSSNLLCVPQTKRTGPLILGNSWKIPES